MMVSRIKWLKSLITGVETPEQEAKQQRLDKSAKIQTAAEAVFVDQLHQIARDEVDTVEQYRNQTVFGAKKRPPKRGKRDEMIIADNITQIQRSPLTPFVAAAGIGAAAWVASQYLSRPTDTSDPPAGGTTVIRKDVDYRVQTSIIPPER